MPHFPPAPEGSGEEVPDDWDAEAEVENDADVDKSPPANGHAVTATNVEPVTAEGSDAEDAEDVSDESDEEEESDHASRVLSAYRKLQSRRVDLVGDYAGNELFLVDGDSLLLRCFSDPRLDFDPGFQLLHAVYNVEQFLQHLARRKCNFHLVFFRGSRTACIPPGASKASAPKYLLARAVVIRHLQAHLLSAHPDIRVEEFSSYSSPEFAKYLTIYAPYFLMAHDGAEAKRHVGKNLDASQEEGGEIQLNPNRAALREMILFFIARGYNVALLNGLEWRDTKVMAMVLERHRRTVVHSTVETTPLPEPNSTIDDKIARLLADARAAGVGLSQRQLLVAMVISRILSVTSEQTSQDAQVLLVRSFLEHEAALAHLPLTSRRLERQEAKPDAEEFIRQVSLLAERILYSDTWQEAFDDQVGTCDLADFVDGRLFIRVHHHHPPLSSAMKQTFAEMAGAMMQLSGFNLTDDAKSVAAPPPGSSSLMPPEPSTEASLAVMPFSNPVFDPHLATIRLQVDENVAKQMSPSSHKIFREVTHWHNAKKPLVHRGPPTAQSAKQAFWAAKREQMFMAEMQKYAASLTNAVGRSLEPETIIVGSQKTKALPPSSSGRATPDSDSAESSTSATKNKAPPKKAGGGKKGQQTAGKQAIMNQIAATKAKKDEAASDKIVNAWHTVCKGIDVGDDPRPKFNKAKAHLASLPSASREIVAAECLLFMANCLLQRWIALCKKGIKEQHLELGALIWDICGQVSKCDHLTKEIVSCTDLTIKTLGLPPITSKSNESLPSRKLPFGFALPTAVTKLSVDLPSKDFQLQYCGPYLERSFDSASDTRVDFKPDGWQRRVLDAIDEDKSVFAVAPTSAGKTFISFYAMRKVLEADDDGVLVYVAPTKALVNQIAAEIQARYSKKFKYGGKSVWAIHTRDYRINNPTGCQVLVTVPHVLQIMLLAPSNANSWSTRVKRIILDEIHSIGQAEDGVVWEQLLLLSPCPIIALSATVGNPQEFSEWLTTTQKAIGVDLVTVQHPHRYSDLRKYFYVPPKKFEFSGLPEKSAFGTLGLERANGLKHIHPVAGIVEKSRGIPEDLSLEPRDCVELYHAMAKHATEHYPVPMKLNPKQALPDISRKVDILNWERELKDVLRAWIADPNSPLDQVIAELEQSFRNEEREPLQATHPSTSAASKTIDPVSDEDYLRTWTLSLLCRLHEQDALPAILFNYDRHECEKICQALLEQLQTAEYEQVKSGPAWARKLEKWEEWKKLQEKKAASKATKKPVKKGGDKDDEEKASKLDLQRDAAGADASPWESFDPEAPSDGYHFAEHAKVLISEMEVYIRQLRRREVQPWLIDALKRGIGIHHAGMNRKYRQVVEILFRKGFLRVVIATGTLALGINMPCKTVVFSGDSVFLTALNYRQCAGRAGRRGFDLLGNVVFQGVSREKVCRLISSRLPDLNGHFPITTTLVLRLFTLLDESKNSKYASSSINALLSQPRLFLGSEAFKDQVMHHLRFSIEYLRRQYLLSPSGAPLNFAGLVSHLYFTENSSFAFHALLKEGYFHELCGEIEKSEKNTLETLMLVMAHLFSRVPCRQADEEYKAKIVKPSSSIVFLPTLPKKAANILRSHNQQTLDVYRTYVETFVQQHVTSVDNKLPLTDTQIGSEDKSDEDLQSFPATKTRSAFVALSGHGDNFASISDLCETTRDGVFLEEAVIPYVGIHPDETSMPLNAWLLDFFKHGDILTIERANGIRRSDIWFMLNDFSLVLATIISSLMGFMKLKNVTDMDALDITGQGDAYEEQQDDKAADDQSDAQSTSVADSAISMPERPKQPTKKKTKKAESWEDMADEENETESFETSFEDNVLSEEGWSIEEEGLRKVLKAFTKLHAEFNVKFRAMWA